MTSSGQELRAVSCRYETMEPSSSQCCSLGSRERERTQGYPSVSGCSDTLPLQSWRDGTLGANPTASTRLPVLPREAQRGQRCCPGGKGRGDQYRWPCHFKWKALHAGFLRHLAHPDGRHPGLHAHHLTCLLSSPPATCPPRSLSQCSSNKAATLSLGNTLYYGF